MSKDQRLQKTFLAATLLAGGLIASEAIVQPRSAQACGGLFCSLQQPVDQAAEKILFAKDGDEMVAHVQIQYTGPSENFSWIVPVPSEPTLGVGSDELFQALRSTTRPQFSIQVTTEGNCKTPFGGFFGDRAVAMSGAAPTAELEEAGRVQIISQEQVGPFESVVLKGDDPETLKQWLKDNGYDVPPSVDPMLDPYIKNKMLLLALKLRKDRDAGDLQPIVMRYKADKPMIPIQLTAVAATDDMDVQVWLLGEQRAIPVNYPHVKINEARINWLQNGNNYRNVVTEAMNEAGGRGFVTEYAGESNAVDLSAIDPQAINPENLRPLTNPIQFAEAAREFFTAAQNNSGARPVDGASAAYVSFLSRHIAKPADAAQIENDVFYRNLSRYAESLERAEITVNTPKAVQELNETLVEPRQNIAKLFAQHPYLTAMYTTLSPEEMTLDPMFDYNPDLETVSAQRNATGIRKCHSGVTMSEAPIDITTPSGLKYTFQPPVSGTQSPENNPTLLPAAAVIQTLSTRGGAVTIRDESARLTEALAPGGKNIGVDTSGNTVRTAAGCACHSPNTPVPISEGAGEGFSYALAILSFFGWRKWRKQG